MLLSLPERFALVGILPPEGNILTIVMVRNLREKLTPTEVERKEFEIVEDGPIIRWNVDKIKDAEIPISAEANTMIVKALKELDSNSALTQQTGPLYEKFCMQE